MSTGYFTYACSSCGSELELSGDNVAVQQYCPVCDSPLDIGSVMDARDDAALEELE